MKILNTYYSKNGSKGKKVWEEGNWVYFQVDDLVKVYEFSEEERCSVIPKIVELCTVEGISFEQFRGPGC